MFSSDTFSAPIIIRIVVALGITAALFMFAPIVLAIAGSALLVASALIHEKKQVVQQAPQAHDAATAAWFILNNLDDAVVVYDERFTIRAMNPVAERLFTLSKNTIIGKTLTPNTAHDPSLTLITYILFPSVAPSFTTLSEAGMWPERMILTIENPPLELETTLHRVAESDGMYVFVKIVRNTTRERVLVESKSEFIRVAAHQLRTPLTAINWALHALQPVITERAPEVIETVVQAIETTERAVKTTNDLLDSARIEGGNITLSLALFDVADLVNSIAQEIIPFGKERSIRIAYEKPPYPCMLNADKTLVGAAIANLIDNAVRYNVPNGTVSIAVSKDHGNISISVSDTGIGIPQKDSGRMFEKMYRASNAAQHEPNGSGLGLSITKTIVERHRGTITYISVPQRGTTFTMTFPAGE
jgi:signal transduction histidine kinase